MRNLYHSLLLVIATATQKELARNVRYLKAENEILRSKLPARVPVTAKEKHRLVRFAEKLGRALDQLTTIVHLLLNPPPARPANPKRTIVPPPATISLTEVRYEKQLGGLLKHYYRKAA